MTCTLYVANLHPEVTESLLWGKFGSVSRVHSIHLQRDKVSGVSLEYAYVNYQQRSEAERAFKLLNTDLLMGEPMYVMWSPDDSYLRSTNVGNIFIGNLEESIDTLALYDTFATFGNILRCKVVPGVNGSGGRGFVHYERVEAAEAAIKRLDGMLFNDQKVFIKHFRSYKERKGVPAAAIPPAVPAAAIPPAVPAAAIPPAPTPAPRVVRGAAPAASKKTPPPLVPAAVLAAAKPIPCVGRAAEQDAAKPTPRVVRGVAPAAAKKTPPPLVPAAVLAAAKPIPCVGRAAEQAEAKPTPRVVRGVAPAAAKKTPPPLVPAAVLAAAKPIPCVGRAAEQVAAAKTVPHVDPAATLAAAKPMPRVVRGAEPAAPRKRAPPLVPAAAITAAVAV